MNYIWTYTRNAILRNGYRTLGMLLGTLLATGLLSAVLFYVDASAAQMTQSRTGQCAGRYASCGPHARHAPGGAASPTGRPTGRDRRSAL
ncbi:MAG: hypothetical protein R2911_01095 [Caldilineaceae bacterium]